MSNSSSTVWPFSVLSNDYGVADYYRYIHPIFAFIACFHSLLCTIVLAQKEVRSSRPFFMYSLVNSAGAVVTFFLLGFLFVSKCGGSVCSISTTYWLQAYATYAIYYVEYVYFIVSALIQIASGIQVYLAVRRQLRWLRKMSPYKVCIVFFGVCSLLGLVSLFTYAIDPFPVVTTDSNGTAKTEIYYYSHVVANQPILTQIATVLLIISNYVFLVILIVVDGLIYSEFRRIVVKRRIVIDHTSKTDPDSIRISTFGLVSRVTDSLAPVNAIGPAASASAAAAIHTSSDYQKARERSLLRRSLVMTFWISVLFSLDRFMKCIYFTSVLTNPTGKSTIYLNAVSYVFDMIIYSSFFFVYMQTSKMFNKKFYQIVFRRKN